MNSLIQRSFLNALGTVAYVAVVATLLQNGERVFGEMKNVTGPITFLTLFVLSAATTSSLVLGKPILMYLGGQKKEAVQMFIYTLCWMALAVVVLFGVNAMAR